MHQCTTAAALPQPPHLVSDAMIVEDRARKIAAREGVAAAPVHAAAQSALAAGGSYLDAIRSASTAALGVAILTGRA